MGSEGILVDFWKELKFIFNNNKVYCLSSIVISILILIIWFSFANLRTTNFYESYTGHSGLGIKMRCDSNEPFISEDSALFCKVSVNPKTYNYTRIMLSFQFATEDDINFDSAVWICDSTIYNLTSGLYSYPEYCFRPSYINQPFYTKRAGTYNIRLHRLYLLRADGQEDIIDPDPDKLLEKPLRVITKVEAHNLFYQDIGLISTIIGIIITIFATMIIENWSKHREHKKNQMSILNSILIKIDLLRKDLNGFKKEITQYKKLYCPYEIKYINSDILQVYIDDEINCKKTEKIKEDLFLIDDKVKLINSYNKSAKTEKNNGYTKEALKIIEDELFEMLSELERKIKMIKDPLKNQS
jgi:hypothetical protein